MPAFAPYAFYFPMQPFFASLPRRGSADSSHNPGRNAWRSPKNVSLRASYPFGGVARRHARAARKRRRECDGPLRLSQLAYVPPPSAWEACSLRSTQGTAAERICCFQLSSYNITWYFMLLHVHTALLVAKKIFRFATTWWGGHVGGRLYLRHYNTSKIAVNTIEFFFEELSWKWS